MWEQLKRVIKPNGAIVLTASQPFTSLLITSNFGMFKYCWVWKKSCGAGFLNAKNAPIKMHEDICVFSKGTTANCSTHNMIYNPQGTKQVQRYRNRKGEHSEAVGNRPCRSKGYTQTTANYPTTVIDFPNDRGMVHDTQKPVALMEYLIRTYTNEGETVLDNAAGSFTTGVACVNTNRKGIMIEKDPHYFKIGSERVERALSLVGSNPG